MLKLEFQWSCPWAACWVSRALLRQGFFEMAKLNTLILIEGPPKKICPWQFKTWTSFWHLGFHQTGIDHWFVHEKLLHPWAIMVWSGTLGTTQLLFTPVQISLRPLLSLSNFGSTCSNMMQYDAVDIFCCDFFWFNARLPELLLPDPWISWISRMASPSEDLVRVRLQSEAGRLGPDGSYATGLRSWEQWGKGLSDGCDGLRHPKWRLNAIQLLQCEDGNGMRKLTKWGRFGQQQKALPHFRWDHSVATELVL